MTRPLSNLRIILKRQYKHFYFTKRNEKCKPMQFNRKQRTNCGKQQKVYLLCFSCNFCVIVMFIVAICTTIFFLNNIYGFKNVSFKNPTD